MLAAFIVENVIIGLLAVLLLCLSIYQIFVDFKTSKAQHILLKATHGITFVTALSFVLVQCDPKALYGMFTQNALNFFKTLVVLLIFVGGQTLMVTYVYALAKSSLGQRPVYLVRVLQISSLIYGTGLIGLMIGEAATEAAYFAAFPLFYMAIYCFYLLAFCLYCTQDLKTALIQHSHLKMASSSAKSLQSALRRIRNVRILVSTGSILGAAYQIFTGYGLIMIDPSIPKPHADPNVYPIMTPMANVITTFCIAALIYGGYHSKKTVKLRPTAQDGNSANEKSSMQSPSVLQISDSSRALPMDAASFEDRPTTSSVVPVSEQL